MLKPWLTRKSTYLIQNRYIQLRQDECLLPNETLISDYYVLEESDFGIVVALTDAHEVVLVRQYKHGIGKIMLEVPAGYLEKGEDPLEGGLRELREETGYAVGWSAYIGSFVQHPTRQNHRGHLIVGTGAQLSSLQQLDPTEEIEVVILPIQEVFDMILRGEIDAITTVAPLYQAWAYLQKQGRV
ncbi:MAG: NUDIX hydrolase [Phototrophicaceae bacterium]